MAALIHLPSSLVDFLVLKGQPCPFPLIAFNAALSLPFLFLIFTSEAPPKIRIFGVLPMAKVPFSSDVASLQISNLFFVSPALSTEWRWPYRPLWRIFRSFEKLGTLVFPDFLSTFGPIQRKGLPVVFTSANVIFVCLWVNFVVFVFFPRSFFRRAGCAPSSRLGYFGLDGMSSLLFSCAPSIIN